ncbi:hypothetical protein EVAR_103214_1 [Eumeta japonica]|uniref:Uncharacterized protein n=1 Tax=Eumeta variegata TaxID=151549 RepID=A0A4C2A2T9_EUMVA|nr:hypothetical protein EVAR_103214_1 [Eumeta japonica]
MIKRESDPTPVPFLVRPPRPAVYWRVVRGVSPVTSARPPAQCTRTPQREARPEKGRITPSPLCSSQKASVKADGRSGPP